MAYHSTVHSFANEDFENINDIEYKISRSQYNEHKKINIKYKNYYLSISEDKGSKTYFFKDISNSENNFNIYVKDLSKNKNKVNRETLSIDTSSVYLKDKYHLYYSGDYVCFSKPSSAAEKIFMSYNSLYILKQYDHILIDKDTITLNYSTGNSSLRKNTLVLNPIKKITINKNDGSYILEPNYKFESSFPEINYKNKFLESYLNPEYDSVDNFVKDIETLKDFLALNYDMKVIYWYFDPEIEKKVIYDLLNTNTNKIAPIEYLNYIKDNIVNSYNNQEEIFKTDFESFVSDLSYENLKNKIENYIEQSETLITNNKLNSLSIQIKPEKKITNAIRYK